MSPHGTSGVLRGPQFRALGTLAVSWPSKALGSTVAGSDLLSGAAFVVSVLSASLSFATFRLAGPRLRVEVIDGNVDPERPLQRVVRVDIVNFGRAEAHVSRVLFEAKNAPIELEPTREMLEGNKLPLVVKPHQRLVLMFDYAPLESVIMGRSPGRRHFMQVRLDYGSKTVKSKTHFVVEEVKVGKFTPSNMHLRRFAARLAVRLEAPQPRLEDGQQRLTITNLLGGPAFKIKLDQVWQSLLTGERVVEPAVEVRSLGWMLGRGDMLIWAPIGTPTGLYDEEHSQRLELPYWRISWVDIFGKHHEQVARIADRKALSRYDKGAYDDQADDAEAAK
jgi:hypothetical protein